MSASVAPGRTEIVIGCPGSQHALKIVDGRHVRWHCRKRTCMQRAAAKFGRPMRVFHLRDIVTGDVSADDEYEEMTRDVE